jgi:pyruvate, water dikinase
MGDCENVNSMKQDKKKVSDKRSLSEEIDKAATEIIGQTAMKGRIIGKVKKIIDYNKEIDFFMKNFRKGDIIVAEVIQPEITILNDKPAAIVTDAGGVTSHAAILSRELGIPCIVGTKVATKILEDGELIEVDANSGVVRRLSL